MNKVLIMVVLLNLSFLTSFSFSGDEAYSKAITVEKVLQTDTTSAGQKLSFPDSLASVTGIVVTIPVGAETGWHTHGHSGFAYIVEGTLTVETESGTKEFGPGSSFAEVVDLAHNGVNRGTIPVKLIAFFTAGNGSPISTKVER